MRFWRRRWGPVWRRLRGRVACELFRAELVIRRQFRREPLPPGQVGEELAECFLLRQGMVIIGRQVRSDWGELDLIAVDDGIIVFVEVKTRRAGQIEDALAAVTPQKQRRIARLAAAYLRRHELMGHPVRFDVVAVAWSPETNAAPEIRHLRYAFDSPACD